MLQCKNITKNYYVSDLVVGALKNVDINFRESEFVSILGPSGCGKTTLLNIIGGLDRYTEGDLIINGRSTKSYKDHDWDSYRNHSIGFVFQSYNLIQHQTVLENVELALTLSGIKKSERAKRATEALAQVGLADQIKKRPNQLSGGQMQRVAIARALVNNPSILLADEPTGSLDSEISIQILDILKEISKTKLVIMVTHNSEQAKKYSNRIIKLLDGRVIDDSNPFTVKETNTVIKPSKEKKVKKDGKNKAERTSMSFWTALILSFKNLTTKKTRTLLTAFAGSIGIIGIALVLSLSNGFQRYVDKMQADTLSGYPLSIDSTAIDFNSFQQMNRPSSIEPYPVGDYIYVNKVMEQLSSMMIKNDLTEEYLEQAIDTIDPSLYYDIKFKRDVKVNVFKDQGEGKYLKTPSSFGFGPYKMKIWQEMLGNASFLQSQYDILAGAWPTETNQVVLVLDKYNQVTDFVLAGLGISDYDALDANLDDEKVSIAFEDFIGMKYKLLFTDDLYKFNVTDNCYEKNFNKLFSMEGIDIGTFKTDVSEAGINLEISAILRPNSETSMGAITGALGYSVALSEEILNRSIGGGGFVPSNLAAWYYDNLETQTYIDPLSEEGVVYEDIVNGKTALEQFDEALKGMLGSNKVTDIEIYPIDFKAKDLIKAHLDDYNKGVIAEALDQYYLDNGIVKAEATKTQQRAATLAAKSAGVYYTDIMEVIVSSINTVISAIKYVLIAFTSISLVVSSIMIGLITYVSVLERTKEIGILRSVGARKKDISRVFNAETFILGAFSGLLGVAVTLLLNIPINIILAKFVDINNISNLLITHAIILIVISTVLTLMAGLIPSRLAAKKDPVEALRSE